MKKIVALCAVFIPLSACVQTPDEPNVKEVVWLEQGWTAKQRQWFHHASQGTRTFPVPYEWFMELEQPIKLKDWYKGFKEEKFSSTEYLQKFGFIPSVVTYANRDGLPVGFAKTAGVPDPVNGGTYNAIGLTCAGCHTGQMTYNNVSLRVDGGPAVTDLKSMGKALGFAVLETAGAQFRRARFKKAVINRIVAENPGVPKSDLDARFEKTFIALLKEAAVQVAIAAEIRKGSVKEGFTRLDALNGIGNTLFGAPKSIKNHAPTNAPVSYPHLWSTSWFDWVQYDGSIMQPMIRNAGEALGVDAWVQLNPGSDQFKSSVDIMNLYRMENLLAGEKHPQKAKSFTGLRAPRWPEQYLGEINLAKAAKGKDLYQQRCVGCHRPAVTSAAFWSDKYWKKLSPDGVNYYEVRIIPADVIGTDMAQAKVLTTRKVDLTGTGIEGEVCGISDGKRGKVVVKPAPSQSFAFALGLNVQKTVQYFYNTNNIVPPAQRRMNGDRPNCLQAGVGYKARPLNGIWATAPFLHNGSVANLYELLSPVSERAKVLYLGYQGFDPKKVGYISARKEDAKDGDPSLPNTKGLTKVIVSGPDAVKGNFNAGHEFNDKKGPGVIGPSMTKEERMALVEYLKTL